MFAVELLLCTRRLYLALHTQKPCCEIEQLSAFVSIVSAFCRKLGCFRYFLCPGCTPVFILSA